jgi:excinuclease ABC subunit B
MREAMSETARRRERQVAYNREHGITPETIRKMIAEPIGQACEADYVTAPSEEPSFASREELSKLLRKYRKEMERAAKKLDFERAAELRDRLLALEKAELTYR